ncbi:MAG: rod shape-determining protein MreC [Kiritimatiellae bacterium]|nr:rod shape-determining protein MreC [Kiritimatiellia bacterium]
MKRDIFIFIFFFILMGVLFSLPPEQTNAVSGFIRDIFAVPQAGFRRASDRAGDFTRSKRELADENRRLRLENETLRDKIRQSEPLERENRELRALLKLKSTSGYRLLPSQLLARDVNGWWQTARLDKGGEDGIRPGLPVIGPDGLLGQIVDVSRTTADMLFLTSPKVRIAARLARSDVFGIVRGQGASWQGPAVCRLDYIAKDAEINPADEVISSGLGGVYPAGLVIGYVKSVQADASGLFQYAEVTPAADFRSLDVVFIVLPERNGPAPGQTEQEQIAP